MLRIMLIPLPRIGINEIGMGNGHNSQRRTIKKSAIKKCAQLL
jgi:hypothetical protein